MTDPLNPETINYRIDQLEKWHEKHLEECHEWRNAVDARIARMERLLYIGFGLVLALEVYARFAGVMA